MAGNEIVGSASHVVRHRLVIVKPQSTVEYTSIATNLIHDRLDVSTQE